MAIPFVSMGWPLDASLPGAVCDLAWMLLSFRGQRTRAAFGCNVCISGYRSLPVCPFKSCQFWQIVSGFRPVGTRHDQTSVVFDASRRAKRRKGEV